MEVEMFRSRYLIVDAIVIEPQDTSSSFKRLLPRPIKQDFDMPYYIGVCSISYADTYRAKAPKELQTTTPKAIPVGRTTFFGQSSGDNRMRVSKLVEVVWNWPKSEEDFSEFYTSFLNNANDKLGKGVVVKAEFPTGVENDGNPKPITELQFNDEEAVWTISLSTRTNSQPFLVLSRPNLNQELIDRIRSMRPSTRRLA
jgi:hypothetical protein